MDLVKNFERDIIKKYRKELWAKFVKALKDYNLLQEGDSVAVAISGGKDSLLLAKLLQEVKRHGDFDFAIKYIAMNPGFTKENEEMLIKNCNLLNIDVEIFTSDIFEVANKLSPKQPCYMCARMRRGFLYARAKELGCNKLALGHHFNDVIETTLMNVFYAGCYKTMVPKARAENFEDIELIRPMYYIKENDIKRIMNNNNIVTMNCGCSVASLELPSKRRDVKQLIKQLQQDFPIVDQNIFKSAENVNINAINGYKINDKKYNFNDLFDILGKEGDIFDE